MKPLPALLAAVVLSGCGGAGGGSHDDPATDPFKEVRQDSEKPAVTRAAPRWERAALLTGTGQAGRSVSILSGAIQWRARWKCAGSGSFALAGPDGLSLARGRCPGRATGPTAATTGTQRLAVRTEGAWRVEVEQQVDAPLREPPLRSMASADTRVLSAAPFYGVERGGGGKVTLYRLASGRLALRLEDFETSPNSDLFVWVSRAARPRTTRSAFRSPHVTIAPLKSTLGDQNYLLPETVRERDVRSIVIWCDPVRIAYAAAAMRRE